MFLTSEEAKNKVKDIIIDDVDNDIVFIVAQKGIGKTTLLQEIYGSASFITSPQNNRKRPNEKRSAAAFGDHVEARKDRSAFYGQYHPQ